MLKHSAHSIVELCRICDPLVLADDRPICSAAMCRLSLRDLLQPYGPQGGARAFPWTNHQRGAVK